MSYTETVIDLRGPTALLSESRIISDPETVGENVALRVQVWRTRGEYGGRGKLGMDVLVSDAETAQFLASMFARASKLLEECGR